MIKDFKEFILRGNMVDLAIAVIVGVAFSDVVDAIVADLFTPLIAIPGSTSFGDLSFTIGGGVFAYGHFLDALISLLSVTVVIFFFVVRPLNQLMARHKVDLGLGEGIRECPHCLSEIPRSARVCAFCTRDTTVEVTAQSAQRWSVDQGGGLPGGPLG